MSVTVVLQWRGQTHRITWADGDVTATDTMLLRELRLEAEVHEGISVGLHPTGPFTSHDHLQHPWSTLALIQRLVPAEDIVEVIGDVPTPPTIADEANL
jgi:hypothetical protein